MGHDGVCLVTLTTVLVCCRWVDRLVGGRGHLRLGWCGPPSPRTSLPQDHPAVVIQRAAYGWSARWRMHAISIPRFVHLLLVCAAEGSWLVFHHGREDRRVRLPPGFRGVPGQPLTLRLDKHSTQSQYHHRLPHYSPPCRLKLWMQFASHSTTRTQLRHKPKLRPRWLSRQKPLKLSTTRGVLCTLF